MLGHGRRQFFELADLRKAPLAVEAVRRIDAIFAIERAINGQPADERLAVRQSEASRSSPSSKHGCAPNAPSCRATPTIAKAIDYMLKRWPAFTRFLDDGRICLTQQCRRARAARHRDEWVILRPFIKCL